MIDNVPIRGSRPTQRISVRNKRTAKFIVVLEPWGSEYALEPGESLEVEEEGGEPGANLELELEDSRLVFYARSQSILRAYRDGEELP
jgi:hypothetical protein